MDASPEILAALEVLSREHGLSLRVLGRYEGGEFGALQVEGGNGTRYALKLSRPARTRNAGAATATLRALGYPAPEYLVAGVISDSRWFALIEELPGELPERLTPGLLAQLIELIDLQAGRAIPLEFVHPAVLETVLVGGGEGFCDHRTMESYSPETAALLLQIKAIGAANTNLDLPARDIVHFDFHLGNILVRDGRVAGIVDWDGAGAGDRGFDLATLLFYAQEQGAVRETLWTALLERAGPERAAVYLAHMMLRQVAWSAEYHTPEAVQKYVGVSQRILDELRASGQS